MEASCLNGSMEFGMSNNLSNLNRPLHAKEIVVFSVIVLVLSMMVAGYRIGKNMALNDFVQCQERKVADEAGHPPIQTC